jgi:hypothetical protein
LQLLPPAILRLDLARPPAARPNASERRPGTSKRTARQAAEAEAEDASWWTARATAAVAPGFTREQLLAPPPIRPDQPGGLFDRLAGVLDELSGLLVAG